MNEKRLKHLVLFIITGITIINTSCSNPKPSSETTAGDTTATAALAGNTIRVMAYNIHHCNPPSQPDSIDIQAIAHAIRAQNPDLVALQEVDVHTDRSGAENQAEEIARQLHMHYFFGKAIDYGGGEYGVAILSKYPLSDETVHRLPTQVATNGEPRIVATAKITLPDGTAIRFGSTHLDAQKEAINRELQIKEIGKIAAAEKLPFVIAGDFNAPPESPVIYELDVHFTRTCQDCPPTIPVENPDKAIDFVAFRPTNQFSVKSHRVISEKYASDHLPVVADITWQP